MTPAPSRRWTRVAIYYFFALAVSFCVRVYGHETNPASPSTSAWGLYWHLVGGIGPAIGAAVVMLFFGYRSAMSLGGTEPRLGLLMIATPAVVMGGIGLPNPFSVEPHLFGVHIGILITLYAILEELGWRGYLQDEFKARTRILRYAIVGVFWYVWHLSFLKETTFVNEAVGLAILIAASIGIGFVADRTRSVLAAAAFHVIGNILGLTTDFRTLVPEGRFRLLIIAVCVVSWLLILRLWRVRDNRRQRIVGGQGSA